MQRRMEAVSQAVQHQTEARSGAEPVLELSVVIPCLNEAETLTAVVQQAQTAMRDHNVKGEIVVADNGSDDGSPELAEKLGARVVRVETRGYGNALMGGIAAARGRYIIMGDADASYDFSEIPAFLSKLRDGHDLVQGCRFPSGGGRIARQAMPVLHRRIGNPLFSWMTRTWFRAPVHDVYCGLRGFSRAHYDRLDQRCTGMEFATEMVIKSSLYGAKIVELPITLNRDGRKSRPPHLRTARDGWRTLRFFLMYSPRWLFLIPGLFLILIGLLGFAIAMPGLKLMHVTFDAHTLLFASLAILCGYQAILFAIFAKTYAVSEGLMPTDPLLDRFFRMINLEKGLLIGSGSLLIGIAFLLGALNQWRSRDFGDLDYAETMRWVIPGATLTALGFQTVLSSFFVSILGMRKR